MNDFLQTLRSSHADRPRTPMTRKHYDDAYYNTLPQYQHVNQTLSAYQRTVPMEDQTAGADLQSAIERLNESIGRMAVHQKMMVNAQEKTADMLERQVIGLEKILDHLKISS